QTTSGLDAPLDWTTNERIDPRVSARGTQPPERLVQKPRCVPVSRDRRPRVAREPRAHRRDLRDSRLGWRRLSIARAATFAAVLLLMSNAALRAQDTTTHQPASPYQTWLDNLEAIRRAGRSGDRSVIPALKKRLDSEKDYWARSELRVALGRL